MVYPAAYDMGLNSVSLIFICIGVGSMIAAIGYWAYLYWVLMPQVKKSGLRSQEQTLLAGLPTSFGPTFGLFTFAWTARSSIHWIVPTLGVTLYAGSVFIILQCIFLYVPFSYPRYAASLFAANDFFRSALACGSILFAHPLYTNMGFARGTSLLGGLSIIGILGMWWLYFYGARLRAMSKFTG
jgi:DHA1 family multidrug resistance protein-like MFS transporter